jgi:hypothetical protein
VNKTIAGFASAISKGATNEGNQTANFTVEVLSGSNILSGTPSLTSGGDLTYSLSATPGTATLRVTLTDDGGIANGGDDTSEAQTFTIESAIELTPIFTPALDQTIATGLAFDPTASANVSLDADRQSESSEVQNVTNGTDAAFDNLIGLYRVINAQGGIDTNGDGTADLTPGVASFSDYARAALNAQVDFTLRAGASRTTAQQSGSVFLVDGQFYAPFIIANGGSGTVQSFITAENAETDSIFNNAASAANIRELVTYFSFANANPDGVAHLKSYGNGVFGFEDLPGGVGVSDNDFNDAVFAFNFSAVA